MPTRIVDRDLSRLASNACSLLKFAGVGKIIGESVAEPADAFGSHILTAKDGQEAGCRKDLPGLAWGFRKVGPEQCFVNSRCIRDPQ
jgi:hypothetical protein